MNALLETLGLCKSYQRTGSPIAVLRDLDLKVQPGEFVAIMGSSGSGKSTLLHILGCLDRPSSGSYHLAGRAVGSLDDAGLSQVRAREIGFVFQKFHLLPHLSVLENVQLPFLYNSPTPQHEIGTRAMQVLAQVGLASRASHRPSELSGGETQRAAIARALVTRPGLILADEPTGNLDASTGAEVLKLLQSIHQTGSTLIMVTHDPAIAAKADRVLLLKDGRFA